MIFYDTVKTFRFSKHQNKCFNSPQIIDFKNLDDSVVIFQAIQTSAASLTSAASAASLASTASTALFPQNLLGPDGLIITGTKITNTGHFL